MQPQNFNWYNYQKSNQARLVRQDLRLQVENTSIHPYNGIGKVICKYSGHNKPQINMKGTGFIVDTNLILTSAHVLYFKDIDAIADQILFYPQQLLRENTKGKKGIQVIKYYLKKKYFDSNWDYRSNLDYAFLQLQLNNIITKSQCLQLDFNYQFKNKKDIFNICGYGSSLYLFQDVQLYQENTAVEQRQNFLYYKHTTDFGSSGSPVLHKVSQSEYVVIGIHKGKVYNYNYCLLLKALNQIFPQQNLKQLKQIFDTNINTQTLVNKQQNLQLQCQTIKTKRNSNCVEQDQIPDEEQFTSQQKQSIKQNIHISNKVT